MYKEIYDLVMHNCNPSSLPRSNYLLFVCLGIISYTEYLFLLSILTSKYRTTCHLAPPIEVQLLISPRLIVARTQIWIPHRLQHVRYGRQRSRRQTRVHGGKLTPSEGQFDSQCTVG